MCRWEPALVQDMPCIACPRLFSNTVKYKHGWHGAKVGNGQAADRPPLKTSLVQYSLPQVQTRQSRLPLQLFLSS
jgi:hypothetical protein